jgi:hypothetical protein
MAHASRGRFRSDPSPAPPLTFEELGEACGSRFPEPGYTIMLDDVGRTVWVRRSGSRRSVGLQVGLVARQGLDAVLDNAEHKLSEPDRVAPAGGSLHPAP